MDMFKNFLDKAKTTGSIVEKKGREFADKTKLKFNLREASLKVEKEKIKLGSLVYMFKKEGNIDESIIEQHISNIDCYIKEMQEIKKQIDDLNITLICSNCGTENRLTENFCKTCGFNCDK
ncbi:MAG: hypothetical protein ACRCZK_02965 [Oscillospiraceae bacterium]